MRNLQSPLASCLRQAAWSDLCVVLKLRIIRASSPITSTAMKTFSAFLVASILAGCSSRDSLIVEQFEIPGISSDQFESHAAFDPRTGDLWFVRSAPDFTGWRLMMSACTPDGWSKPIAPPIAGDGVEADPWFSMDGNTLW